MKNERSENGTSEFGIIAKLINHDDDDDEDDNDQQST